MPQGATFSVLLCWISIMEILRLALKRILDRKSIVLWLACLAGAAWMRLLIRSGAIHSLHQAGLWLFLVAVPVAWIGLLRWRRADPYRCSLVVGLCGGVAGAGIAMMLQAQ